MKQYHQKDIKNWPTGMYVPIDCIGDNYLVLITNGKIFSTWANKPIDWMLASYQEFPTRNFVNDFFERLA